MCNRLTNTVHLLFRYSSEQQSAFISRSCTRLFKERRAIKSVGMVYQSRIRKRVHAYPIHRGPDGSAFQKCESCGRSVAIALADMHECESNNNLKKLKGQRQSGNVKLQNIEDQPRSAFRFFMEEFLEIYKEENEIAIDSKGFEMWKKMSKQERQPYIVKAEKVNSAHTKALLEEENDMAWVDDEADSAEVGKYDENYAEDGYFDGSEYDICDDPHSSDSFLFWSEISDSKNWAKDWPNLLRN